MLRQSGLLVGLRSGRVRVGLGSGSGFRVVPEPDRSPSSDARSAPVASTIRSHTKNRHDDAIFRYDGAAGDASELDDAVASMHMSDMGSDPAQQRTSRGIVPFLATRMLYPAQQALCMLRV